MLPCLRLACHFFVFTTFDVLCNLSLNRRTAIWNVFVKMLIVIKVYGQGRIQEFMIGGSKLWIKKDC